MEDHDAKRGPKKPYRRPEIIHVELIEARAVCCAKVGGDDTCEALGPAAS
jgi:hypothetical protein